jgi:5-bromo-4-chloroindolyl phosphate hydrolysis protein
VVDLQTLPLRDHKELVENVEKQQEQMREMQKALIDQSKQKAMQQAREMMESQARVMGQDPD